VPDTGKDVDGSMSLEKGTGPAWDQFAANESLFGLKTDYDESIYTTPINKAHPDYHQRMFLAEKKAREIERSAPITSHHAEERQADNAGGEDTRDEAQKYVFAHGDVNAILTSQQVQRRWPAGLSAPPEPGE
jgi:PAB1-binding protein PBP1